MKAWVLYQKEDIRFEEIDDPIVKNGEVLVAVKACGICGSDVPRVYQGDAHVYPLIIGHEFSGKVMTVGSDVSEDWIGKRVGVFPLIPCRHCIMCEKEKYEMCENYSYLGSRKNGGFAELVAVPQSNIIELPDGVTYDEAAMIEPMAVAVHAVRKGTDDFLLDKDTKIAVCGLGTIGLLVISFLISEGYTNIYAIGNKNNQKKRVIELGLKDKNYFEGEYVGTNVSLYFECVGKNESILQGIDMLAHEGTMVTVGNPFSDIAMPQKLYWKILRKQLRILGTWNSSFRGKEDDDWHHVIKKLVEGKVHPERLISHKLVLEQAKTGLEIMRTKKEDYCKIMVCN